MKKKFRIGIIVLLVVVTVFIIYLYSSTASQQDRIMGNLEPDLYKKLSSNNNLNLINKSEHFDDINIVIEDCYCDENMLVLSIGIEYGDSLRKVYPKVVFNENNIVFQGGSRKLTDLKDEYLLVVIPEDEISKSQNINIEFLNPLNDNKKFDLDVDVIKNDYLKKFSVIKCKENSEFGVLYSTPYGMFMKIKGHFDKDILKIVYDGDKIILPKVISTTEDDETVFVFDKSIFSKNYNEMENDFYINLYTNSADEELSDSFNCMLK